MKYIVYALLSMFSLSSFGTTSSLPRLEQRPFVSGSMHQIIQANQGQDFIVSFWSIDCPPCQKELSMWQTLSQQYPSVNIILVSTDDATIESEVLQILNTHNINALESWQFYDANHEKLRYEIDRNWYGEMPRTYFYSASGEANGVSGLIQQHDIEAWINREHAKQE